jgi:hypothetical protein
MHIIQIVTLVGILILNFALSGCATFKIPAPKSPVKPWSEPVAERSVINVPINISITALSDKLNQLMSKNRTLNKLNQENNITGRVQDFLNGQTTSIDADLLNNIYLRMTIGKVWDALQNPIKLNYDLSLFLNPQSVQIATPTRKGDTAKLIVGFAARPKLVSGDIPKPDPQPSPNFSMVQGLPENGFHISLDNELSFDFISKELTKKLEGKIYYVNNKTITIERIKIYGSDDLVVGEVHVKGAASGTIYLTGIPAYDESTTTLYINNLDYTVETKNALTKAAAWLLHTGLRDSLENQAKWFIGDKIDMVKDFLSDGLNRKINRYVSISGKIYRMRLVAVGITNVSLKAVLVADGKVDISIF